MTELERAANDFFPIDEKTMSLDEQSDQLLRQIGFKFGANWQYEQFEKERLNFEPRLKHCDELTAEQAQMESDFVVQHLLNFNRTPTFIDAIEYGRRLMINKACEWLKYYISYDDFGGNMEWLVPFENDECMIQHFKTYMEE